MVPSDLFLLERDLRRVIQSYFLSLYHILLVGSFLMHFLYIIRRYLREVGMVYHFVSKKLRQNLSEFLVAILALELRTQL